MHFLLADDHGLFRDSMAVWLKRIDDDLTIDFAEDFDEVYLAMQAVSYDLVLLDLGMPKMQGIVSVKKLCDRYSNAPVLIVSADESAHVIRSCIDSGAVGYVTKSSSGDVILQAVKQVLAGAEYIPLSARESNASKDTALSQKQLVLLAHLSKGLSNKEISLNMCLSEGTVKQYVTKILKQLDVDNRMQAGLKAKTILGMTNS